MVGDLALVVRANYLAMAVIGWFVIVPLGIGSLLVGIRVLVKLVLTIAALTLLLVHMRLVNHVSSIAATTGVSAGDLRGMRIQLVGDAGGAQRERSA